MIRVRHLRIRYFSLIMVGIIFLFVLLLASPRIAENASPGADVLQTEPPATAVLFLLDESGTVNGECGAAFAVDTEAKRYRIVRFFMTLMGGYHRQEPEKHNLQIGVALFAEEYKRFFPFMPSSELFDEPKWGSFYELLSGSAPDEIEKPNPCETNFKQALEDATQDLLDQEASEHILVLITDGRFEQKQKQQRKEERSEVEDVLESFESQVQVYVILLGQSYVKQKPRGLSDSEWELWGGDIEEWQAWERDGLINLPDDAATPTRSLADQPWFQEFLPTVKEFEKTTTVIIPVPPFRRYMRLFFLPDNLVDETWTPAPSIQTGVERWWFDPPAGEIEASIRSRGEITQTLAYYAYSDEPYPVNLEAQVIPDRQEVGRPVELQAWLTLGGGRLITDTAGFSVQASVEPGETYDLVCGADGHFTYTVTEAVEGDYRVRFNAATLPALELLPIPEVERALQIGRVPHLEMSTSLSFTSPLSATVVVTVTVENPDAGKRDYIPTLEIAERGETIPCTPWVNDRCVSVVQVPANELLTLRASLPEGETEQGIPFPPQHIERQVATHQVERQALFMVAQVVPERQEVGQPVQLQAWLVVGGRTVTDTTGFSVQARVEPGEVYTLTPGPDGQPTHTLTNTVEGEYQVTFSATISPTLSLAPISSVERVFRVGRVPRLRLTIPPLATTLVSTTLAITVTVENFDVIQGVYTPTLEVVEQGSPVSLAHQADGNFTGTVIIFPDSTLTLRADLPKGLTSQGIPFLVHPDEKPIAYVPQIEGPPPHEEGAPFWLGPITFLAGAVVGYAASSRVYGRRTKVLVVHVKPGMGREEIRKEIDKLKGDEQLWPHSKRLGGIVAQGWKERGR